MHILFLSRWYPYPPDNGSKLRIYNLLRGLSQQHQVSLLCFYDLKAGEPDHKVLRAFCTNVQGVPFKPFRSNSLASRLGYFSNVPRAYLDMHSIEMEQRIQTAIQAEGVDLVIASQTDMAAYARAFLGKPAVFEEVEMGVWRDHIFGARSLHTRLRSRLTWIKHRRFLAYLMQFFRLCTVVSEKERQILLREVSGKTNVAVIPNCVDLEAYKGVVKSPQPYSLIFTGSLSYHPNYEAICWFLKDVFPRVRAQVPGANLVITGEHAGLPLPQVGGVTLTGLLQDVRPNIASAWCSIVPLHTGGGTRLKILEAMAVRTPVVTTSKGAEGLEVEPGKHVLVSDDAQGFADCILQLFRQSELRERLAEDAYQLVRQRYNWEAVMWRYLGLIDQVVQA
jgi:glycosyltransferase involved in cell wall biosynthesis